jgi:hypothetical protein
METKYYTLGTGENSRLIKIIQILFGILCLTVAVFWLIYNIRSMKADKTLWITITFLTAFSFYQVWAGLGKATRFIEIGSDKIKLKRNIFFPAIEIAVGDIQKIELYPFNLIFHLKTKKRITLRFGATYQETNELIKDDILIFCDLNSISSEIVVEKI